MARALHVAVVQNAYDNGLIVARDALDALRDPLTPGDVDTAFDDSDKLVLRIADLGRRLEAWSG
jgi:hypothetical protein